MSDGERYLVRARRGYLGFGEIVADPVIEIAGSRISKVGRAADFGAADLAASTTVSCEFVLPGLVDAHTHLGIWRQGVGQVGHDLNETSELVAPHVRSLDSIDPRDSAFAAARAAGVTSIAVSPGSLPLVGGQVCLIKTAGTATDDMLVKEPIGIKVSFGAVPLFKYGNKGPATRMGAAGALRESLIAAGNYVLLRKERGERCPRNLRLEALCRVLDREIPLHVHAHEAHGMLTMLRIVREFGIDMVVVHGTDAYQVADRLAAAEVPVIFGPALMSQQSPELVNLTFETAAALHRAGVAVASTTDHGEIPIEYLITCAGLAVKHGLPVSAALASVTSVPARICLAGDRIGTIAEGYDADLACYDGDPLDLRSRVVLTTINGQVCYRDSRDAA